MIDEKDVSIIIPTILTSPKNVIYECVKSLRETTKAQIVVAYNGVSSHDLALWDAEVHPDKELQLYEQGQSRACNAAVAIVNTPWVFITNDDMIFPKGWFEKLTADLRDDMLCVSPKLIEPRAGAPTFQVYFCGGAGGDFQKQKFLDFAKTYFGVGIRTGFNLPFLIKKELLDIISTYDINYDPWGSNGDSDLQAKIHLAGVQPYQNTNSIVYHFSMTSGTSSPDNRPYWDKNWHYFIEKWGFPRQDSPKVWFSQDIIDYEKLKYKPWWKDIYKKK